MATYAATATRPDRAKAIFGVIAVHIALAFAILSGLNVSAVSQAVERLTTITIVEPPPPPPVEPPPPPAKQSQSMKKAEGAAAKKAEASPVVAPQPKLPLPSPIPAAKVAGIGTASTSGAALSGNGTGAGGYGSGLGGGGTGSFVPAEKITKIPDSEYRRLVAVSGMNRGSVGVLITVTTDGLATNCRITRPSGSPAADALMCQLTQQFVRFLPARDPHGRAVAQDKIWYPNWSRR
jgi:protein TonB